MINGKVFFCGFVFCWVLGAFVCLSQAGYVYPLEIFTNNGSFCDGSDLALYVEVSNGQIGQVDFTFYNESSIYSSIARVYFDADSFLSFACITEGPGTSFGRPATPGNLPGGNSLDPPFVTFEEVSLGSDSPRPQNGINPGEWLQVTFDLKDNIVLGDVIDSLNAGDMRIGTHVIALPDGSSESAVAVPEPATIALLGLGGFFLLCITRR